MTRGRDRHDPLASPAIGTGAELLRGCDGPRIDPRIPPPPPGDLPALAVSLSGGGYRASFAGLGVLRFLADAGLLGAVRYVSSVSGGSIASGVFAMAYEQIREAGYTRDAFDRLVLAPFVERVASASFQSTLIGRLLRRPWDVPRRTLVLADLFDRWFYQRRRLQDLTPDVRFIYNAANATTGVRFGFERDRFGDYVTGFGRTPPSLLLSHAVAASAAYPGAFAPLELPIPLDLPCIRVGTPKLMDGGAYDNLGLEPLDGGNDDERVTPWNAEIRKSCLVILNAGGQFRTGAYGRIPIVRDVMRTTSLLYRQTTALRTRMMVERFKVRRRTPEGAEPPPFARRGVLFGIATVVGDLNDDWAKHAPPPTDEERKELALVKTSLDTIPRETSEALVRRGWWLAGATLATYEPKLVAPPYPAWRSIAG